MKHTWITSREARPGFYPDGDPLADYPDRFARSARDPHNGPQCKVCGFNFCMHCHPKGWDDESCGTDGGGESPSDGPAMTEAEFAAMAEIGRRLQGEG